MIHIQYENPIDSVEDLLQTNLQVFVDGTSLIPNMFLILQEMNLDISFAHSSVIIIFLLMNSKIPTAETKACMSVLFIGVNL